MTGAAPGLRQPLPGLPRPTRPTRQAEPAVAPPLVPNVAPHLAPQLPPRLAPRLPPHLAPQLPPLVPPQGALQSPSPSAAPATPPDTPPKTPRATPATPATPPVTPPTPSPAAWRKHWRPARWLAIARLSAQALNLPLGLALIALLLAAGLALVATPRWRAEQTAADQAAHRLARARVAAPAAASAASDEQRLLAALPDADSSPQRVADLLALAARHGLVVHSTRQVLPAATATAAVGAVTAATATATTAATTATAATATAAVSSPAASATAWAMAPLRLSMGVQGGYRRLRQFVADALQHDDALLLDQLRLARPSAQAREVTADLQWLLLQREQRPERPERPARPARADSNGPAAAAQPGRQR